MPTLSLDRNFLREVERKYSVDISRSRNGVEQRRLVDSNPMIGFEFQCPIMGKTDMQAIQAFWDARNGSFESFVFTSPMDDITYNCRFLEESWRCSEISDQDGIYDVSFGIVVLEAV